MKSLMTSHHLMMRRADHEPLMMRYTMNTISQPSYKTVTYTLLVLALSVLTFACQSGSSDQGVSDVKASDPLYDPLKGDTLTAEDLKLTCSEPLRSWDPNGVHELSGTPQFEGWYYRVSEPETRESWVIITAYWLNSEGVGRSFIELIQGSTGDTYKQVFEGIDVKQYQENPGEFEVMIGDVSFSADRISGQFIDESGAEVSLDLDFEACARWGAPEDERNRWTMGWVTEVIGPPLKWHVHHLKGEASGEIAINSADRAPLVASMSGAPLHQEKNWGSAFPKRWVWLQSNVFEERPDVAFAAAGGPVFGFDLSPSGYMMGIRARDRFYNWRTQDGHSFKDVAFKIDSDSGDAVWTLRAESLRYRADIRARGPISELIAIDVPGEDGLEFGAFEHLSAELNIELYARNGFGWRLIDRMTSNLTAVEAGGEFTDEVIGKESE